MTAHVLITLGDVTLEYFVPESRARQFDADARDFGYGRNVIGGPANALPFTDTDILTDLAVQEMVGKWFTVTDEFKKHFPYVVGPVKIINVTREAWDNHDGFGRSTRVAFTDSLGNGGNGLLHDFGGCRRVEKEA